ncbi:hypothetical protein [Crystallibacter crystallopoietes]|uniref:hypothetical protein n=1 Tax=Crystallibacter crystallopoietes TaxID=37928 RepID=UPI00123782F5|nr:hypothetical protein [Arthrobacter crystallopoietes]
MSIDQNRVRKGVREGGQFAATSHAEAGIWLTPQPVKTYLQRTASIRELFEQEYERLAGDTELERRYPDSKSETRRLLAQKRAERGGKVRYVHLDAQNTPYTAHNEFLEVTSPKGRPVVVELAAGKPNLKATSGTAIIRANSVWGNSITVAEGATAVVVAEASSKVHVTVEGGSHAVCVMTRRPRHLRTSAETRHATSTASVAVEEKIRAAVRGPSNRHHRVAYHARWRAGCSARTRHRCSTLRRDGRPGPASRIGSIPPDTAQEARTHSTS